MPPHLLGIGAHKGASTWLQHVLDADPQFWNPPGSGEICFFDRDYKRGEQYYLGLYASAPPDRITFDVSPTYLDAEDVPQRMRQIAPSLRRPLRFILTCREPTSRLMSEYKMWLRYGNSFTLDEALSERPRMLERGYYFKHLQRYFEHFERDAFLVLLFDDIRRDERGVLREIEDFLGLPGAIEHPFTGKKVNAGGLTRHAGVARAIRKGGELLRGLGWMSILYRLKASRLAQSVLEYNRVEYVPSEDETQLLQSLKDLYREDVVALAELMERPDLPALWGYC